MVTYKCEICENYFEIEEWEAFFGNVEHYEFGLCSDCFNDINNEDSKRGNCEICGNKDVWVQASGYHVAFVCLKCLSE